MEACLGVEREVERVISKFKNWKENKTLGIEEALSRVRELKAELDKETPSSSFDGEEMTPVETLILGQTMSAVRDVTSILATDHRELHSTVSKVGKAVDRNFVADFDSTSREDIFSSPTKARYLHEVILQHFYRQGQLDIAECLSKEADIQEFRSSKDPFLELNVILESLHRKDLGPALEWTARHREELEAKGSGSNTGKFCGSKSNIPLELRLHKLHFVELLRQGNRLDAIAYAKKYFPQFVGGIGHHDREVQNLMGALIYAGPKLAESPYSYLLNPSIWLEICDHFVKEACTLMGLAVESPLSVVINAGCTALPALLNIKQVMLQRQVSGVWNAKDELPIEIDLGNNCRYHSIFACPILRQQTSDNNPPLRLTCGHCISRDALNKLTPGNNKVKCPYCPVEQNPTDARQITF